MGWADATLTNNATRLSKRESRRILENTLLIPFVGFLAAFRSTLTTSRGVMPLYLGFGLGVFITWSNSA